MSRRKYSYLAARSPLTEGQLLAALESEDGLLTEAGAEMERITADLDDHIERARKLRAALEALGASTPEPPAGGRYE